jgi:hypothetical protein
VENYKNYGKTWKNYVFSEKNVEKLANKPFFEYDNNVKERSYVSF